MVSGAGLAVASRAHAHAPVEHFVPVVVAISVGAQISRQPIGADHADFGFPIRFFVQLVDAIEDDLVAIYLRAVLSGPDQLAVAHDRPPGGPGPADAGGHGIGPMRPPGAQWLVRGEQVQLVGGRAVDGDAREQPVAPLVAQPGGIDGADGVDEHAIEHPVVGKAVGPPQLDAAALARFGDHVDRAGVLEHEGIGKVAVGLQGHLRLRCAALGVELDPGNHGLLAHSGSLRRR